MTRVTSSEMSLIDTSMVVSVFIVTIPLRTVIAVGVYCSVLIVVCISSISWIVTFIIPKTVLKTRSSIGITSTVVVESSTFMKFWPSVPVFRIVIPVVPNLWPAGQKWPARPQKVALDLLKNFKNICAKTAKLPILTG